MGGQVRLMSRRKQWIGLTIPVVMKNSERAMILLTVALPLLCGITFPRWTTCHWEWRTDPSNPLCLKGSFSTVLPDSSDGKLGYYNFALCGRWHIDCGYTMSPLSLLPSSTKCPAAVNASSTQQTTHDRFTDQLHEMKAILLVTPIFVSNSRG